MAGTSLRLFLARDFHFYWWIYQMLSKKGSSPIKVRALICNPEKNHELPFRSFVEESNQDRSWPKDSQFDWSRKIDFNFDEYFIEFYKKYGKNGTEKKRRIIQDLEYTQIGINTLQGTAKSAGNFISHREYNCAPYCTAIIFPSRVFYTSNLLCTEVPVNLPMIVFHKSSEVYKKLRNYVEFLWWISDPNPGCKS